MVAIFTLKITRATPMVPGQLDLVALTKEPSKMAKYREPKVVDSKTHDYGII
jgi:hypothetical protein